MLPSQKAAVDRYMVELIEALAFVTPVLLNYLESRRIIGLNERELIESKVISADKLTFLFHMLKAKDSGWSHLLSYLRSNQQSSLADKLQNDAGEETGPNAASRSALVEFSLRLAQYYQQNYAYLPTMGGSPKQVNDAWVPLQMDGQTEGHLAVDRVGVADIINRLKSAGRSNVALIKGDPGLGKTTLAKKIAYDWAINYGSAETQQFSLVLAVPLAHAERSNRLDQLAIDYFLSLGGGDLAGDLDKARLTREISQLGSQLLVILDGLDEYRSYDESPFRYMFAAPFEVSPDNRQIPPPMISFKLIVTSRPYGCVRTNAEFWPLSFVILPLDVNCLNEFVRLYCQTSHGVAKVAEYLNNNAKLVIQVPLILTFICYLADSVEEIPTNMTSLYDSFIRQMLWRESRQRKLEESVDIQRWKESGFVKTISELAYQGVTTSEYEFTYESMDTCHVTNDSFICGFLLHKFDVSKDRLKAEFSHRSIQEFFAALHCYQLMLDGRQDVLMEVNKLIITGDSQFGRFFFGFCSKEERFDQATNWLSPSLSSCGFRLSAAAVAISRFGASLIDSSSEENRIFGQRLFGPIGNPVDCSSQH